MGLCFPILHSYYSIGHTSKPCDGKATKSKTMRRNRLSTCVLLSLFFPLSPNILLSPSPLLSSLLSLSSLNIQVSPLENVDVHRPQRRLSGLRMRLFSLGTRSSSLDNVNKAAGTAPSPSASPSSRLASSSVTASAAQTSPLVSELSATTTTPRRPRSSVSAGS